LRRRGGDGCDERERERQWLGTWVSGTQTRGAVNGRTHCQISRRPGAAISNARSCIPNLSQAGQTTRIEGSKESNQAADVALVNTLNFAQGNIQCNQLLMKLNERHSVSTSTFYAPYINATHFETRALSLQKNSPPNFTCSGRGAAQMSLRKYKDMATVDAIVE
jgi:hypothetical protein